MSLAVVCRMSIMTEKTEVIGTLVVVNESGERRKEGIDDKRRAQRVRFVFISSLGGNERGQERAIYMHMQPTDRPTDLSRADT